jgi:hypothetical protein
MRDSLRFSVTEQKAFWRPIAESFRDFFGNLSTGISQAITAVADILPWLLLVIPGLYLVRFLVEAEGTVTCCQCLWSPPALNQSAMQSRRVRIRELRLTSA